MFFACSFDTSGVPNIDDGPTPIDGPVLIDGPPDVDASLIDAPPPICTAGETRCMGNDLETCNAAGSAWDVTTCDLGCDDVNPPAHCDDVVPSNNIPTGALYQGTQVLTSMNQGGLIFYADTGRITSSGGQEIRAAGIGLISNIYYQTVNQAGGPTIGVFSMGSLELLSGHNLRGIGANALAIATSGIITINGVIDLTGGQVACPTDPLANRCAGPGGSQGGDSQVAGDGDGGGGGGQGGGGPAGEAGGGGGGHGGAGGVGGTADINTGGTVGPAYGVISLEPLTGGGGGGGGGSEGGNLGGVGGGGGGAVQLISHVSITIDSGGPCGINAGGAGSGGSGSGAGGGGGGAGGGILLEAPSVTLGSDCVLAANGGGGGGANNGQAGNPGALDDQVPGGGSGGSANGGDGSGGSNLDGVEGGANNPEAGGGGGGGGIIRVNTQGGVNFTDDGTLSPQAGTGRATEGTLTIE